MVIRSPYEKLAGCYHLARFTDKTRLNLAGQLPLSYRWAYCIWWGLDRHFLNHFGLEKTAFIEAVLRSANDDSKVEEWFKEHINDNDSLKNSWNEFAVNLGKKGYPMSNILLVGKRTFQKGCNDPAIDIIFKALDRDEGRI